MDYNQLGSFLKLTAQTTLQTKYIRMLGYVCSRGRDASEAKKVRHKFFVFVFVFFYIPDDSPVQPRFRITPLDNPVFFVWGFLFLLFRLHSPQTP